MKKYYTVSEKKKYYEGISTAKKDFLKCKSKSELDNLLLMGHFARQEKKSLWDEKGVSFYNGYIYHLQKLIRNK